MKIAFYIPENKDGNTIPGLGVLYLMAILRNEGHECHIFDSMLDNQALKKMILFNPDIAGFSVVTSCYNACRSAANELKRNIPTVKIIFGGAHPSALPVEVASEKFIDFVLSGECEFTLPKLIKAIGSGTIDPNELKKIGNIYFKHQQDVISGESTEFLSSAELDALPYPAFDMMDLKSYFSRSQTHGLFSRGRRILPIITSRGCPYNCNFCCRMMGKEIRKRNADAVVDEIKFMIDRYEIDELYIEDDNFTFDRKRALYILNRIIELPKRIHLKFANGIRIEHTDDEIFDTMKRAGAYSISFGIESGCERTLDAMGKKINLELARKIIQNAKSHGFLVGANCIIGYPGETVKDISKSIDYFLSMPIDSMAIVNLIPFPGTETRNYCERMGYLMPEAKNWDNYYFSINSPKKLIETPELSYEQLCQVTKRAYLRMYMRPSWIIKNIKNFKLNQIVRGIKYILIGSK